MFRIGIVSWKSKSQLKYKRWRNYDIRFVYTQPLKKAAIEWKEKNVKLAQIIRKMHI